MKKIVDYVSSATHGLEIIIAFILMIAVILQGIHLFDYFPSLLQNSEDALHNILSAAFNLIIVIEFIRMLIQHSMENVIEVLVFALARSMIVDHSNTISIIVTIVSISILLIVRKHCLLHVDFKKTGEDEH